MELCKRTRQFSVDWRKLLTPSSRGCFSGIALFVSSDNSSVLDPRHEKKRINLPFLRVLLIVSFRVFSSCLIIPCWFIPPNSHLHKFVVKSRVSFRRSVVVNPWLPWRIARSRSDGNHGYQCYDTSSRNVEK